MNDKAFMGIVFGMVNGLISYSQWKKVEGIREVMQVMDFEKICQEKCTAVFKSIPEQLPMCIFNCENFESLNFKAKLLLIDSAQNQMYIASALAIICFCYGCNSLLNSKRKMN